MSRVAIVVPAHAMPGRTPAELLAAARRALDDPHYTPAGRYAAAHLAALRGAAAVLAARGRPGPRFPRRPITSVWVLLTIVAPELGEWAAFFAAGAAKRSAAEAGITAVTDADADQLRQHVLRWLDIVQEAITR